MDFRIKSHFTILSYYPSELHELQDPQHEIRLASMNSSLFSFIYDEFCSLPGCRQLSTFTIMPPLAFSSAHPPTIACRLPEWNDLRTTIRLINCLRRRLRTIRTRTNLSAVVSLCPMFCFSRQRENRIQVFRVALASRQQKDIPGASEDFN
jgi:hypothetical protein